ncbi:hypothetical protein ACNPL4_11385, partial [Enterococcus faecium]|uniref:hypothetical protein n=1 Tax=Enterococcus faecium TaxID=1352 RepID=UPI003AB04F2F
DQEELIHLISNYSKISLYQHHLTKSQKNLRQLSVAAASFRCYLSKADQSVSISPYFPSLRR